ncbi:MAG TPA: hypothetical protein VNO55_32905, partial [Polyangia bacterium]|nr:hypothetical protein [Polyangia bacterium]
MFAAAVIPVAIWLGTTAAPPESPSPLPPRVFTNTSEVTALAAVDGTLWVATRGGLEEYDLATLVRRRLYTTADGLTANEVTAVASAGQGVVARTENTDCVRRGGGFVCSSA